MQCGKRVQVWGASRALTSQSNVFCSQMGGRYCCAPPQYNTGVTLLLRPISVSLTKLSSTDTVSPGITCRQKITCQTTVFRRAPEASIAKQQSISFRHKMVVNFPFPFRFSPFPHTKVPSASKVLALRAPKSSYHSFTVYSTPRCAPPR